MVDGVLCDPLVARVLLLMLPRVWLCLVPEVAGGDADGGVVLAMVLLMSLAWVV